MHRGSAMQAVGTADFFFCRQMAKTNF